MLDINFVRENLEKVKEGVAAKQVNPEVVDEAMDLYNDWRVKRQTFDELQRRRNEVAVDSRGFSAQGKQLKEALKAADLELHNAYEKYKEAARKIPNLPADDVKSGKDESENDVIRTYGEPKTFDFKPKDHLELGEKLRIIDVEQAAKVSGTRFAYLKGDLVLIELALVQFALNILINEGFIPVIPPVLIKKEITDDLGYWQQGGNEDYYWVHEPLENQGLYLVGTAEHSIVPMHKDEIFNLGDLPKRYAAFSTCFRREAGSYGKDTKGILRVHQFDKVEMVSIVKKEDSDKEHEYLLSLEEKLFQSLEIPYQVVKMCSGDLGAPAARKYDIEAWMPGQKKYREVTSTSTTTDFQSRRLNIKYTDKGKTNYVHMLNGTAFAIGRTIIAIMENYQQADGSIKIPKVLQPLIGKKVIAR